MLTFFLAIAANFAAMLLAPKPKLPSARRYGLNEFEFPTASEDRAQQLGFGTFRAFGNVIWYGDYLAREVKKRVRVNMFKTAHQTIGYRYHVGMWMTLCALPCDEVTEIRLGDQLIWSGSLPLSKTTVTTLDVHKEFTSAEGQEVPDGLSGRLMFFNHAVPESASRYTPLANKYMEDQLGEAVPAYPNTLHVVWLGPSSDASVEIPIPGFGAGAKLRKPAGFVGSSPRIEALSVVLKRRPDVSAALSTNTRSISYPVQGSLGSSNVRAAVDAFLAEVGDINGDANPALATLELLSTRSSSVGPMLSPYLFDIEAFFQAARRLKDESHGISFPWETSKPVDEVVSDVLLQTAGVLETNPRTAEMQMRLLRSDDEPVAIFDASNIERFDSFTRTNIREAPNVVEIIFQDRDYNWQPRVVRAKNLAGIRAAGSVRVETVEYLGVTREPLASILATRELRKLSGPFASAAFSGRVSTGMVLKPGDPIQVTHPTLGQSLRMRVTSARFLSMTNRGRVGIECVEDIFRSGTSAVIDVPPPPDAPYAGPPVSLVSPVLTLAPYALTGDEADHLMYYGQDPGFGVDSYEAAVQEGLTTWDYQREPEYFNGSQEPAIVGTTTAAWAPEMSTSGTMFLDLTPEAVGQWKRNSRGKLYLVAGSEWMSCASWFLDSTGRKLTVKSPVRGIFDTLPEAHPAGTPVTLLLGYVLDEGRVKTHQATGALEFDGPTAAVVRAESKGAGGKLDLLFAPESQASWQYNLARSRAPKPLPPGRFSVGGRLGALVDTGSLLSVSRSSAVSVSWVNRNRLARVEAGYFGTGNSAEPGVLVAFLVEFQTDAGAWQQHGAWRAANAGDTLANFDAAGIPAGARKLRVSFESRRAAGAGFAVSARGTAYFQLNA